MKRVPVEDILNFKESLSVLLISGLFILLAARMNAAELAALGWGGLGVFLVIQFVARPLKVAVATWGTDVKWRERVLLSWIAPRGIVAAAVSALFALRLESQGVAGAQLLVPLTFMVIIGTVALQSATARPLARWLKVAEPEAKGFLIVGANPLARAVGEALCRSGFRTLLTDSSWHSLSAARMAGLAAWYGNPTSARADRQLDLVGLGGLLALSPQADLNALAVLRFKREFGVQGVYRLADAEEANAEPGAARESETAGALLFGPGLDYAALASALSEGAKLKETLLTEDFDFHDYLARHENRAIPLFAVTPKGRLRFFVSGRELRPEAGWKVFALVRNGGDSDAATAPTDTRGVG
jgi:hypothetical protein